DVFGHCYRLQRHALHCGLEAVPMIATARAARKSVMTRRCRYVATMGSRLDEVIAMATYKGECFCGGVQLEAAGGRAGMGYCHCRSCRSWSGGPVNAFTLWKPGAVRVTARSILARSRRRH